MQINERHNVVRVTHPAALVALTRLRDKQTQGEAFVRFSDQAAFFLAEKVMEDIAVEIMPVETPMGRSIGHYICEKVVLVPILRAGLALQDPFRRFLPEAKVHHIGIARNEKTALPQRYYPKEQRKIQPDDKVILLDPMCATGGSACDAIEQILQAGARKISFANVVASSEGIDRVRAYYADLRIVTLAIDQHLDDKKYIVPGLGDYGDRYFGT